MIKVDQENVLTIAQATRVLPQFGENRIHTSTVWRWCKKGLKGVRLEYIRVGSRICTSQEALSRFFVALAEKDNELLPNFTSPIFIPPNNQSKQRQAEIAKAERALDDAGL